MEEWSIPEQSLWDLVPLWEREPDHNFVHLIAYMDPKYQYYIQGTCSKPWCVPCEKQRLWRYRNRIAAYLQHNRAEGVTCWWFLTRSIRNSHNVRSAFSEFNIVRRAFHNDYQKAVWHPFHRVRAFVGVMEMTYSERTGYNLHQHMLVGAHRWSEVDRELVASRWSTMSTRAVGKGGMTHMPRMNHDVGAVAYLTKYISKGSWGGLSRGRVYMIRAELKGRNRIQVKMNTSPGAVPKPGFVMCCVTAASGSCQRDVIDEVVLPGHMYDPEAEYDE